MPLSAVLEQLFEDLNSYSETSINLDGFNSLELKLFPFLREFSRLFDLGLLLYRHIIVWDGGGRCWTLLEVHIEEHGPRHGTAGNDDKCGSSL